MHNLSGQTTRKHRKCAIVNRSKRRIWGSTLDTVLRALALLAIFTTPSFASTPPTQPFIVKHADHSHEYLASRDKYFLDLLTLALNKSGVDFSLRPVKTGPRSEYLYSQELLHGNFDIQWLNTTERLEDTFIPVRIPLFKGLIGWRIFIVRAADQAHFSRVKTLEDLRKFTALQGFSWPDTRVLRHAGVEVKTATDFISLSRMLEKKHGDFFPRAITEAWSEIEAYEGRGFAVDNHIVVHYPAAYYYFVRKDSPRLAAAVEKGLKLAIEDGSFDKLFLPYFEDALQKSALSTRVKIPLTNPSLPPATPLDDKRLWFSLE